MSKSPETTQPTQPFSITKPLGVKPLFKLDEEPELKYKSGPKVLAKLRQERGNSKTIPHDTLDEEAGKQ